MIIGILIGLFTTLVGVFVTYQLTKNYYLNNEKRDFKNLIDALVDELEENIRIYNETNQASISTSVENYKAISKNPLYTRYCTKELRDKVSRTYSNIREIIKMAKLSYPINKVKSFNSLFNKEIPALIKELGKKK